jgi:hypothetical protein
LKCIEPVNKWETNVAERLATFLDGEALIIYLEMAEEDRKDFELVVKNLKEAFHPQHE